MWFGERMSWGCQPAGGRAPLPAAAHASPGSRSAAPRARHPPSRHRSRCSRRHPPIAASSLADTRIQTRGHSVGDPLSRVCCRGNRHRFHWRLPCESNPGGAALLDRPSSKYHTQKSPRFRPPHSKTTEFRRPLTFLSNSSCQLRDCRDPEAAFKSHRNRIARVVAKGANRHLASVYGLRLDHARSLSGASRRTNIEERDKMGAGALRIES